MEIVWNLWSCDDDGYKDDQIEYLNKTILLYQKLFYSLCIPIYIWCSSVNYLKCLKEFRKIKTVGSKVRKFQLSGLGPRKSPVHWKNIRTITRLSKIKIGFSSDRSQFNRAKMTEAMIRKKPGMASVKDMPLLQDGPPPGGFAPVRYARRISNTGPSAMAIFLTVSGAFAWGMYQVGQGNKIRR